MNASFYLSLQGDSNFLFAARCNLPDRDEQDCLDGFTCLEGKKPSFVEMPWREVRDRVEGRILTPSSYTHILDCVEPGKDTE